MSSNPNKRKGVGLEKLNTLRDKIRQAYSLSKGEVLHTPKNKNSVYYSELKDDIERVTGKALSEGTLLKIFYEDDKINYQLNTISAVEEYVDKVLSSRHTDKGNSISMKNTEEEVKEFAKRIYIEMTTRKAGIPIDEEKDVIEEIYNSWYKLFCLIRDKMEILPVSCFKDAGNPESIMGITNRILNDILRPHLTEHQARFRDWLEKAKQNREYKNLTPQELQKKYPNYGVLVKSMKEKNKMLIGSAEKLCALMK